MTNRRPLRVAEGVGEGPSSAFHRVAGDLGARNMPETQPDFATHRGRRFWGHLSW
jgi:hypothetical protein